MNNDYRISTDKSRLDTRLIHDYLCNKSYWAKGRSYEDVITSIDNSMCFGLYDAEEKVIGFARVVTDKMAFAYLMDVFILDEYQHKGLGTCFLQHILHHPDLKIKFWLLGTRDAHEFYRRLGFSELTETFRFMEIVDKNRC